MLGNVRDTSPCPRGPLRVPEKYKAENNARRSFFRCNARRESEIAKQGSRKRKKKEERREAEGDLHGTTLYYAYDRFAVNSRLHFQSSCHISLTELYTVYRHVYDVLVSTIHPAVKSARFGDPFS